jgi:fibronectin type 3 domain-containing protein
VGEGAQSNELYATPITVPSAPQNIQASFGDAFVNLIWQAPSSDGGSSIIAYNIYIRISGGETHLITIGNVLMYNDTGLTNGQTYYYKVSAVNSVGEGAQSNELNATPTTVPSAPQNFQATSGNTYVNLSWAAPISDGGSPIIRYQVWSSTTSGEETFLANVDSNLWYNNTGLTNGQTYYYKVSAVNAVGDGLQSNELYATPSTVPSAPQNLHASSGDAFVNLTWTAPSNDGGASVTNYKIYRGTTSGGETYLITIGNVLTYNDTGLTNGQTYWYSVSAVNHAGEGPTTSPMESTPFTVPDAPTGLIAVAGDASVTLNWTAPVFDGGNAITGYNIYKSTTETGTYALIASSAELSYADTGLTNGFTYWYKVSTVNGAGEGAATVPASGTPLAVPSAPQGLTATPGSNKVTLAWQAPGDNGGSAILSYQVYRSFSGVPFTQVGVVGGSVLSYVDTNVTAGTNYTYYVKAVNVVGTGAQSTSRSATPLGAGGSGDDTLVYVGIVVLLLLIVILILAYWYMRGKNKKTPPKSP